MHPAKPGVFYQKGGTFPNKDAIIDTKRINDCVLCFWRFQQRAAVVHGLQRLSSPPSRLKGHFFGQRADDNGARVIVIIRAGGQRHDPRHVIGRGHGLEQGFCQRTVEVGVELGLRIEHGVALRIGGRDEGGEQLDAVGRPLGDVPDDGVLLVKLLVGKLIEHGKHRAGAHMVAVNYRVKAAHGGVVGAVHEQRAV